MWLAASKGGIYEIGCTSSARSVAAPLTSLVITFPPYRAATPAHWSRTNERAGKLTGQRHGMDPPPNNRETQNLSIEILSRTGCLDAGLWPAVKTLFPGFDSVHGQAGVRRLSAQNCGVPLHFSPAGRCAPCAKKVRNRGGVERISSGAVYALASIVHHLFQFPPCGPKPSGGPMPGELFICFDKFAIVWLGAVMDKGNHFLEKKGGFPSPLPLSLTPV